MPHDQKIRTRQQVGDGPDGFHQDAAAFRVAQSGGFFRFQFGFLGFPDFKPEVVDDRILEFVIALVHGGHSQALHDGITVFHTVPEAAGGRVDNHTVHGHSQVFQEDVDLFGNIDVNGRRRDNGMAETHGRRADTLVVLVLYGAQDQVLALAVFGDFFKDVFILFGACGSPHDHRYVYGGQNLLDRRGSVRRARILVIGIRASELKRDHFRAVRFNAFFRPGRRIADDILKRLDGRFRPVFRLHVPDFHGDFGLVGHFTFELVKRVACLAADSDSFVTLSQLNIPHSSGIRFFEKFKSQCLYLLWVFKQFGFSRRHTKKGGGMLYPLKHITPPSLKRLMFILSKFTITSPNIITFIL